MKTIDMTGQDWGTLTLIIWVLIIIGAGIIDLFTWPYRCLTRPRCTNCGSGKMMNLVSEDWHPLRGKRCTKCGTDTEPALAKGLNG